VVPVSEEEIQSIMKMFETAAAGGRCEQCGFDWTITPEDAEKLILETPTVTATLIGDRWDDARRKPGPKTWSPTGYVWHMTDAIGIWAERLKAIADDPKAPIVGFDQDDLADVRGYDKLSPVAALWAFERRVRDFNDALELHPDREKPFDHPDFGSWSVAKVVVWMAHDLFHHTHDISQGMARE